MKKEKTLKVRCPWCYKDIHNPVFSIEGKNETDVIYYCHDCENAVTVIIENKEDEADDWREKRTFDDEDGNEQRGRGCGCCCCCSKNKCCN